MNSHTTIPQSITLTITPQGHPPESHLNSSIIWHDIRSNYLAQCLVCMHMCVYMYMDEGKYVCVCVCVYIYIYIYTYIYIHLRGAFNKFPDFFIQTFKIVIDSWKFTILLLYILWDDWPIFMISGSNEQLQQQLEYTLLRPDCHSWWISKMQSDTLGEWYAIKFCFKLGKNATETYGMLQTAFGPSCMNQASVFEWHKRFKEGRDSVRDDERCGRSKEVRTPELIGQRVRVMVTMLRF